MNKKKVHVLFLVLVSALFASTVFAQDKGIGRSIVGSQYVISAKAGGVNFIQGEVSAQRKDGSIDYLVKGDTVKVGDRISTGNRSKIEILLNPGSYARLAGDTKFEFVTTNLDDLQLKLNKGHAIFEVYAGNEFKVTVITPQSKFYLIKSGVYRVDAFEDGTSRIEVRKGKAQLANFEATKLKKSRAADVNGTDFSVAKFNRKDRDEFELWSRNRAKLLAKANARLKRRNV